MEKNKKLTPEELILLKTLLRDRINEWKKQDYINNDYVRYQVEFCEDLFNKLNDFL